MSENISFNLQRFVEAQDPIWPRPLSELEAGRKQSHWMWYVFPQLIGLGSSPMAQLYGLVSIDEARAYLRHPILHGRLFECVNAVLTHAQKTTTEIFGQPDDMMFHSSMTLFDLASDRQDDPFQEALQAFWKGEADSRTVDLLNWQPSANA